MGVEENVIDTSRPLNAVKASSLIHASVHFIALRKVLAASAFAEATTGVVLALHPTLVMTLLFGANTSQWTPLGRIAGVALLALGLACWPRTDTDGQAPAAVHAMLTYNSLIAGYLIYLGAIGTAGFLLWPAVAEHAVVTALLFVAWLNEKSANVSQHSRLRRTTH